MRPSPGPLGIRRRGNLIEGAIATYVRDGRLITLMCMPHLANPSYYGALRTRVDDMLAADWEVHFEGVMLSRTPEQLEAMGATPFEATQFGATGKRLEDQYNSGEMLGFPWVAQHNSVMRVPQPEWINHDAHPIDWIRLLGPDLAPAAAPLAHMASAAPLSGYRRDVARAVLLNRVKRMAKPMALSWYQAWRPKARRAFHAMFPIMMTYREQVAALAALACEKNVVMLWHGQHFPGIVWILAKNGFVQQDFEWLPAITLEPAVIVEKKPKKKSRAGEGSGVGVPE